MSGKQRFVVVGLGSIGRRHARLLSAHPHIQVEFCESNPAVLRQARHLVGEFPVHASFESVLASEPDMVLIATPHRLHSSMTCQALLAGAHVLCEKPMSDRLSSALEMARIQRHTGRVLRIGFMQRFNPGVRRLKQLLYEGKLGTPVSARYQGGSYVTLQNSVSRHQREVVGSVIMDHTHGIDLMQWLLDIRPAGAYARGTQAGCLEATSSPNVLAAVLDYESAFLGELHMDYVASPELHFIELYGDEGWARLNITSGALKVGAARDSTREVLRYPYDRDELYRTQIDGFLQAVAGHKSDTATAEEGGEVQAVVQAILDSLQSGQRETVATTAMPATLANGNLVHNLHL